MISGPIRPHDATVLAAAEKWAAALDRLHAAEASGGAEKADQEALVEALLELYQAVRAREAVTPRSPIGIWSVGPATRN